METLSENRCCGGVQGVYRHESTVTGTPMQFSVYRPPQAATGAGPVPVLWWLSGLTCTEENFTTKAGAQRYAAQHGLVVVAPDTSPRGLDLPGEHDTYDFGSGAGFYVDATQEPWSRHYRMHSYITEELPVVIGEHFSVDMTRQGIFGHSMGGHGALVLALRHPARYRSVSAFAPIVAPSRVPWGEKAFTGYLGEDRAAWANYDATALVADSDWRTPILIDQGDADTFLGTQLTPELFVEAAQTAGVPVTLRMQPGYDHSYYFMATFMGEHIAHHARLLAI
ncbi:S-formylglutathione hydrolase [Roseospira marina]|uniref:S-formylglutathione hydrolase n=1 Tax=Roseospira marina TaxID=140057 RepID=A0A5M6IH71_9PROT|nr:S-formylglutathione hydrolase [Roseospira marina]KAA5607656.1 S-formylglutathione hydrolase [Roseospira marina]MBB4312143.1 S-formylglutathione hydrolase [Roseospira marina]MBB5085841.1 S-formylglutathione hydrolase [Roseospira marina]